MKTLQEILRAPRPLKEGGRAVDIETTEVFDVVQVGELHAMCESYGTPHTLALSQLVHIQDAIDCGLVDGWRKPDNEPVATGIYLAVARYEGRAYIRTATWASGQWVCDEVLAWRDLPPLPELDENKPSGHEITHAIVDEAKGLPEM